MPQCNNCKSSFKTKIKIDNKWRNLGNRKYCLTCSPFGLHNTRKLNEGEVIGNNECKCKKCNKDYIYDRVKNRRGICGSCQVTLYRKRVKIKLVAYKGGKCQICNYNKCIEALQFHHKDPNKKEFQISGMSLGFERLKIEVDKCDLVCANCHIELHNKGD